MKILFIEPAGRHEGENIILNNDCSLSGLFPQDNVTGIIEISSPVLRISSKLRVFCLLNLCSEINYFGLFRQIYLLELTSGRFPSGLIKLFFLHSSFNTTRSIRDSLASAYTIFLFFSNLARSSNLSLEETKGLIR